MAFGGGAVMMTDPGSGGGSATADATVLALLLVQPQLFKASLLR